MHLAGLLRIVPHKVLRQPLALTRDAPLPIGARPCQKPPHAPARGNRQEMGDRYQDSGLVFAIEVEMPLNHAC